MLRKNDLVDKCEESSNVKLDVVHEGAEWGEVIICITERNIEEELFWCAASRWYADGNEDLFREIFYCNPKLIDISQARVRMIEKVVGIFGKLEDMPFSLSDSQEIYELYEYKDDFILFFVLKNKLAIVFFDSAI